MPKLTGPLFSLDARQTLGGTITYSKWKNVNYARLLVDPYNPKSEGQQAVREAMTFAVMYFTRADYVSPEAKVWWNIYAEGTGMSGWNRFTKFYMAANFGSGAHTYDHIPDPQ